MILRNNDCIVIEDLYLPQRHRGHRDEVDQTDWDGVHAHTLTTSLNEVKNRDRRADRVVANSRPLQAGLAADTITPGAHSQS
jgi:hypothetical protein